MNKTGDCHDQHGLKDMCVDGAIQNFTSQLQHYGEATSDRRCTLSLFIIIITIYEY